MKDSKIKRFSFRKGCSGEKSKADSLEPFPRFLEETEGHSIHSQRRLFEVMRHVNHGSPQLSQQRTKIEILSRKDQWRNILSNGMNP